MVRTPLEGSLLGKLCAFLKQCRLTNISQASLLSLTLSSHQGLRPCGETGLQRRPCSLGPTCPSPHLLRLLVKGHSLRLAFASTLFDIANPSPSPMLYPLPIHLKKC